MSGWRDGLPGTGPGRCSRGAGRRPGGALKHMAGACAGGTGGFREEDPERYRELEEAAAGRRLGRPAAALETMSSPAAIGNIMSRQADRVAAGVEEQDCGVVPPAVASVTAEAEPRGYR